MKTKSSDLILAFLVFVLSVSISTSCNLEKRVEKQQKTFDNIGRKWLALHPCANDSFAVYIPGKRDSIPIEIPVIILDTNYINQQIDSIEAELKKKYSIATKGCKSEIKEAYNVGYSAAETKYKNQISNIKIPAPRIDTLKITLKDKTLISLLQQDIANKDKEIADLKLKKQVNKGKSDKWFLLFVIACLLLSGSLFYNFKK